MELNYLRYFYEVAKAGSFTEAARRLHISQSALSKSVALLEDREGVRLLSRSKRGVALTPIGNEVYLKSERLFALVSDIESTCKGLAETCEGPFSFGASEHLASYLLVPALQKMRGEHPDVLPKLVTGIPNDLVTLLLGNEIEFALFFTQVNVPAIKYEPISQVEMAVVAHPKLVAGFKGEVTPARLKKLVEEHGFIGSIKTQWGQHHPSSDFVSLFSRNPPMVLESNSQEVQKRYCMAGGGVAYLARFMVQAELQQGKLAEIELKKKLSVPLYIARRRDRELPLTARTFLEVFRSSLPQD